MIRFTLALAACSAAVPALAQLPDATDPRAYRASYDAAHDRYCLRVFGRAQAADPRPGYVGEECRTAEDWSKRGVQFRRAHSEELARSE